MSHLLPPSWKLPASLWLLSAIPVAAGAVRMAGLLGWAGDGSVSPANARFFAAPGPVGLHIVCATLFCLLGALQFDASTRQRSPHLHCLLGRIAAPCGLVAALTGLWLTIATPIPAHLQGDLLRAVRIAVGVGMALAIVASVHAVLRRRIVAHRAWMLRAYALGLGAGTQVLLIMPVTLLAGEPSAAARDVLMASAWGLNAALAEWLIRRTRPSTPVH